MKRTIRRLVPVNLQDIPAVEGWLSDLAAEGLFLVSGGGYIAKFEAGEPAKATYRLEPASNLLFSRTPDEKRNAFFLEFGWEYVCSFGIYFHVYCSKLENSPEIHTDLKEQAQIFAQICRIQALRMIFNATLVFIALYYGYLLFSPSFLIRQGIPYAVSLIILCLTPVVELFRFFRLYQIYHRLKNGIQLEHSADYRNRLPLRRILRIVPAFPLAILYFSIFCSYFAGWEMNWPEAAEALPMVSLAEIEQENPLQIVFPNDRRNLVRFRHTALAPVQYTVWQDSDIPSRQWRDHRGGSYDPRLTLEIYQLRFPSHAKLLLSGLQKEYNGNSLWEMEILEGYGTDEAYLYISSEFPRRKHLFLRAEDTVLYANYWGEADLRPFLPAFSLLTQEDLPTAKPLDHSNKE